MSPTMTHCPRYHAVAGGISPAAPKMAGKKMYRSGLRGNLRARKNWMVGRAAPMNQNQFVQE